MNVTLPPVLESFVRRKVEAGAFESESDLVSESLRQMQERDEAWSKDVAGKIDAGLEQAAAGRLLSAREVDERLKEAKEQWRSRRAGT